MIKRRTKKIKTQNRATTRQSQPKEELTFLEHLYELRSRLFWITASLIVTSAIGFHFKDYLVDFVMAPLHGQKLVYLTPGGGFSFIFTVCLYFGALLTIPVVMYHIYRFLQPVLGGASRRLVAGIIVISSLLATAGAVFGYYVAVPAAIQFLTTFAGDAVSPNLTAESYLNFIVAYMLGLAALFQLPLLLFIIDHVRPFPPGTLLTSQRFVIVGSVIAAAVITPTPDIVNQLIVAGPIILIYQLGAIAVFIRRKAARRTARPKLAHVPLVTTIAHHASETPDAAPSPASALATVPPAPAPRPRGNMPAKTIDGFRRPLPANQSLVVPRRDGASSAQSVVRRTYRSIDGVIG